jgi:hypothetical protein
MSTEKDLNYWKANAEEDYKQVPISVLRYITELETAVKNCSIPNVSQQRELLESFIEWHNYKSSHHRHLYKSDAEEYLDDLNESNCG